MEKFVVCLKELATILGVSYQTVSNIVSEFVDKEIIESFPSQEVETFEEISFSPDLNTSLLYKLRDSYTIDNREMKSTPIEIIYIMKHRDGLLWKVGKTVQDVYERARAVSGYDRDSFTPVFWVYEPKKRPYRNSVMSNLEMVMLQACEKYIIPGEKKLLERPSDMSASDFESLLIKKLSSLKRERLAQRIKMADESIVRHALLYIRENKLQVEKERQAELKHQAELKRQAELERQTLASQAAEKDLPFADPMHEDDPYNFGLAPFNVEGWTPATKKFWDIWNSPLGKTIIRQVGFVPRPDGYKVGCPTEWIVYRSAEFVNNL